MNSQLSIHPTWRIVAGMIAAQVPGVILGLYIAPTHSTYTNCWYGAAFAMPFGFVGGLLWQITAAVQTLVMYRWIVVGYGLFSAVLPAFGALTYGIWSRAAV